MNIAGYTLPFFPMRPFTGRRITAANADEIYAMTQSGEYYAQRKLNGDRALLGVKDGLVEIANRHGAWLKHPVINKDVYSKLPSDTLLDGEVFERKFYPFEALIVGGENFMRKGPEVRGAKARELCTQLGVQWLYEGITLDWVKRLDGNGKEWEGLVLKETGSPYVPLGSEGQDSSTWKKLKWV